ncbi:MAG: NTP transferase domain-containing protein, partial [Bacteroidaceae bacterium]|nr:NTP transferase domain-containing protein [Bacteroidaceae bacterium]
MNHNYCLILAGGVGSRLWPVSRGTRPKQFLDLFGSGRTLLQQTYDRVSRFFPADNIYVSTNVRYLPLVYEQLPMVDDEHILEEPLRRGTLAAVAWGSVVIGKRDAEARLLVSPADQLIRDEGTYGDNVLRALEFVSDRDDVLVLGIRPTRPDTGYGYIQTGDEMCENGIFRIKTVT